jgi:uncharacterized protein YacL
VEIFAWLDKGIGIVRTGLDFVRDLVEKVALKLPWESTLTTTILFLIISIWISYLISKRFTIKPLRFPYIIWMLLITISIFLNLVYL